MGSVFVIDSFWENLYYILNLYELKSIDKWIVVNLNIYHQKQKKKTIKENYFQNQIKCFICVHDRSVVVVDSLQSIIFSRDLRFCSFLFFPFSKWHFFGRNHIINLYYRQWQQLTKQQKSKLNGNNVSTNVIKTSNA